MIPGRYLTTIQFVIFFWYDAISNELLDISVCNSLDLAYNIYTKTGKSIVKVWYENSLREWSIDFSNKTRIFAQQTDPSKQIFLRTSQRAPNFFYKNKDNIWVPLSLSFNYKIDKSRANAKQQHSKMTPITIRENMKNTGVLEKLFRNSKFTVDLQKKKLYFHQEAFDLKFENELDYNWRYQTPRMVNIDVPRANLQPEDPEFIKVRDPFNLTMPQNNLKTVIRYYLPKEYETFLTLINQMQSQVSYDVKEKLLWSWEFNSSEYKYNVTKNLDSNNTNNPYGTGYQFASSANIAVKLRKKQSKKLVLAMVLIGNPYYTLANKNGLRGYEAVEKTDCFNTLACYYPDSGDGVTGWIYVVQDDQRILPMYVINWE